MSNDELVQAMAQNIRLVVREEVSTIVSASEQRLNERIDKLDGRIGSLETKVGSLETKVGSLETKVGSLEAAQNNTNSRLGALEVGLGSLSVKVATVVEQINRIDIEQHFIHDDLTLVSNKLDKASTEINSLKASQITLEIKVDENIAITKREMQKLHEAVQSYASNCKETTLYLMRRLDAHEALPGDQAHPNSAA